MPKQPHARNRCGAKTRSGNLCKNGAMDNGRCRMHGGKSTGAPKGNQNSKKHGFFSKYIPQETLEIMGMLDDKSPADLIWDQIQIQYAAIIRAQQIMFVRDQDDMTKEVKKTESSETDFANVDKEEYEIQFAWDKHATYLNAQSRAMSELRSLIKQFLEMAHDEDERKLKLQLMQTNIDKLKAETERIEKESDTGDVENIVIVDAWGDDNE